MIFNTSFGLFHHPSSSRICGAANSFSVLDVATAIAPIFVKLFEDI
ncbi:hypothetical protein HY003_03210 [Candidatus Saccharibacteria bacterium]|nr:hypothetical protein [Candidatus Saccharibacteria bacterium]MBI3338284.1 hypothetical protein [Candidatus Saccharibacteria bacterium]